MTTDRRRTTAPTAAALALALALVGCSADSSDDAIGAPAAQDMALPRPVEPEDPASPRLFEMTDPAQDALSTFALDIDTGSYTRFRDAVRQGVPVAPGEVRTEEFVNYFEQDHPAPASGLDVSVDAMTLPFGPGHRLVRVGISSAPVSDAARDDADLVLVVDCSGSMSGGKMETTQAALRTLVTSLRTTDRVAMICYSTRPDLVLEPTPVAERAAILAAVDELAPQESTNVAAALEMGYDVAASMRTAGRMTRVVLVSDGVANVDETGPEAILERIGAQADKGINLVSVGVGITTYDDHLLEQLADQGDGWHVYIDTQAEAERVFATGLTGSLVVTARDAKAQVEFDPAQVAGYRLLGYENRAVADEDFRDDTVDGGEIFAGHTATALYEVALRDDASFDPFVTATVRYLDDTGEAVERSGTLTRSAGAAPARDAAPRLRLDMVIALLTDRLVGGPWSQLVDDAGLLAEAEALPALLDGDEDVRELVELIGEVTR